jgi:predicted DNA repair protein MutK
MVEYGMNNAIEGAIQNALHETFGDDAIQIVQRVNKIAERQGGKNLVENYQILGKRVLIVAGVAVVGISAATWIGRTIIARRLEAARVEKIVRRILEEERAKQEAEAEAAAKSQVKDKVEATIEAAKHAKDAEDSEGAASPATA